MKEIKEEKEGKEGQETKDAFKDAKDVEASRSVSVMSSLSYRKRSHMKDSIGGTGDENSLFSTLKEQPDSLDRSSLRRAKNKSSEKVGEDFDDRSSVISQAYSEATSKARRGLERRWTKNSPEFDKETTVSSVGPSRSSVSRGLDQDDVKSTTSGYSLRRSSSWMDDARSDSGSVLSPGSSRRSRGQSPGSVSLSSRTSLARSSRLSEFDLNLRDDDDDAKSVAFSEGGISAYSPRSLVRNFSSPTEDRDALESTNVKPVTHRNYLDPDLEKAINEVLSFKPIKFKRRSLEDSEEEDPDKNDPDEDDRKSVRSLRTSLRDDNDDDLDNKSWRRSSSLQRSASGSAIDCGRSTSSLSSRSKSKKKKKKNRDSQSDSSSGQERERSSKKKDKKRSKKGRKKESESESSESESSDSASSSHSTVSYRSSSSIKRKPGREGSGSDQENQADTPLEDRRVSKKDEKKKKKTESVMMKYLYRPGSD